MNDRPRTRRIARAVATTGSVMAAALSGAPAAGASAPTAGVLKQSGDGWALTAADGRVLYEAHGRSARILCLRRANELGALRIRS